MLLRKMTLALFGLTFILAACGDQASRAVGPREVLLNQTFEHGELVTWLHEFTEPGNVHAEAVSRFNEIQQASNKEDALNALIAHLMANYSVLTTPSPPREPGGDGTLESELAYFLATIAAYYGIIDGGSLDVEHFIGIVNEVDIPPSGSKCFPTNLGNAAMCLDRESLEYPAFVSVIAQTIGNTATFPLGVIPAGPAFEYNAYGSIIGNVVVLLCTPKDHSHLAAYTMLRSEKGEDKFEKKPPNTSAFDGECDDFQVARAPLLNGDNIFARGVNAAGSFLLSAITPKSAHATHSLAHSGTFFSDWLLGQEINIYTIKLVGVNSGTIDQQTNTFTVARNSGNFTFYVEVYKDNVLQPCQAGDVVKATPTFANAGEGAEITASSCSYHGATQTQRHQITFTNLSQNVSTTGSIAFTVNNKAAANQVGFISQ